MTAGLIGGLQAIAIASSIGCATIVAGGPDQVPITTNPPGAYVYLDGQVVGQTPMTVTLDRGRTLGDIRIYYPGFQPVQFTRHKSINLWIIGNFFIGMIPIVVDFITGDWQRFEDEPIAIGLTPGQAPPPYGMQPQLPYPQGQPPMQPYPQQPQQPQQPQGPPPPPGQYDPLRPQPPR